MIFGSINATFCKEFSKSMQEEFEMRLMRKLKFFLGIQINQILEGTYVHQSKYTKKLLKKFDMSKCKMLKTHMHP